MSSGRPVSLWRDDRFGCAGKGESYVPYRSPLLTMLNNYRLVHSDDLSEPQKQALQCLLDESDEDPMFLSGPCERSRERMVVVDDRTWEPVACFEPRVFRNPGSDVVWHRTNRPYVARAHRDRGIMRYVLAHWYQTHRPAVAWIRDDNAPSIALFQSLGFKRGYAMPVGVDDVPGHEYILDTGTRVALEVVDELDAEESEPSATEDLEAWLEGSAEKVRRNVVIETPETLGTDYLLHISTNTNIREFVPLIGSRQDPREDRTVPRICVAPHLLGCFIGYQKAGDDFHVGVPATLDDASFKGGWKIYGFKFDAALRPNNKLVPDTSRSEEIWLTAYNRQTAEYVPETLGKAFMRSVSLVARSGKAPSADMELYVEVSHDAGVRFSKNLFLEKGYWVIEGPTDDHVTTWQDDKDFEVRSIERNEYISAKAAHADLLALPVSLLW